jgi:hypothetical protein
MNAEQYNEVVMVAVAALAVLLGVYLAGRNLYWRKHAARVTGTIVGVKYREVRTSKGGEGYFCYAVYRYTLPSGGSAEGMDFGGDCSLTKKETGRQEQLLVFEDEPARVVVQRSNYGWALPLLLMGGPGLGFAAVTLWMPPHSKAEFYPLVAAMVVAGLMLSRLWVPPGPDGRSFWRSSFMARRPKALDDVPTVPFEQIKT